MLFEIIIILLLIIVNGIFSMAEMALVSSRKIRLDLAAKQGDKRAAKALEQANSPSRFLSTVQIGITLIGILTGIFSGETIAKKLEYFFNQYEAIKPYAATLSITVLVIIITYFSLVIGELVPKQIALSNPERISKFLALPMNLLSKITAPFNWLLDVFSKLLIKLFGIKPNDESKVTEEEIKALVEEGTSSGAIQEIEQDIVERVFHLGDRKISSLMTSRSDIIWLNINDSDEINLEKIISGKHSVYPVCDGGLNNVLGILYIKDLILPLKNQRLIELQKHLKTVLMLPETNKAYQVLEKFQKSKIHYSLVVDEFGTINGLITINDILDALVGDMSEEFDYEITKRDDGSVIMDAVLPVQEFSKYFNLPYAIDDTEFSTVAGLIISTIRRIPKTGEKFIWREFEFEILDMDGNRIDKVLVRKTKLV